MTRQKILKSHTIIPQEFYIERSADAQLRRIVMDMGRPGYILVARQMGKTNLLLNAKRTLSSEYDKYLYIDVSNILPEIRQFFRNLIDVAIDSDPDSFAIVGEEIRRRRSSGELFPPHKEHELELRDILRATKGRFVICLDEIDALTKTEYADRVFSLIRSIYFSGRVNIPEFARLTYILSGVAEPSELIKSKDVSPFNIGEKIYLDDFSLKEFEQFIIKAELPFDSNVKNRIFYWANGSPRISWDICSALEDILISERNLSVETVDQIVRDMYLTNFDLPPIDHIRTLVEVDSDVRNAIISIHYGKSEGISDSVRNRLYLAGITRPDRGNIKALSIRNLILSESLSEKWIQDVEKRSLTTLEFAENKYKSSLFSDALSLYEEYLLSEIVPKNSDLIYFKIGHCQFKLDRYQDAIGSFEKTNFGKKEPSYYSVQHMTGLCYLFLGKHDTSINYFRRILEQDIHTEPLYLYFDTCLNLSAALFYDFENNREEITTLNRLVIDSESRVREVASTDYPANTILYLAYYNLAMASKKQGDILSARNFIDSAINLADARGLIALLVEAIGIASDRDRKRELLKRSTEHVITNRLVISQRNKDYPLDFTLDVCSKLVEYLHESGYRDLLDKLLAHLSDKSLLHSDDPESVVSQAVFGLVSRGDMKAPLTLIRKALSLPDSKKGGDTRRTLMTVGMFLSPTGVGSIGEAYLTEFINSPESRLSSSDYRVMWNLVQGYIAAKDYRTAESIISRVRELVAKGSFISHDKLSEKHVADGMLVIDSLEFDLFLAEARGKEILQKAEILKERLDKTSTISLPYFEPNFLEQLRAGVRKKLAALKSSITVMRIDKKIGRNAIVKVQFPDGTTATGKFKKFQAQLATGACKLADD